MAFYSKHSWDVSLLNGIRRECVSGVDMQEQKSAHRTPRESLCLMFCMWNSNISKTISIFKWYISLHLILTLSKCTSKCFSEYLYTEDCSAAAHVPNMFTNAESWAPRTEAVATFPKSHIIECFFNMVAVSKHLGLAFKTRPLPAVGSGRRKKKKKTSQVKFKDVFLLEARQRCHKPRETFSCSTFFMVSLWVSSLPFSLHLGSRVTYCCTGCGPQPAGHCGVASSSLSRPEQKPSPLPHPHQKSSPGCPWMALTAEWSLRESATWTALLKLSFTTFLK